MAEEKPSDVPEGNINRPLSQEEREQVKRALANPSTAPSPEDKNLEAWLIRLSIWGKVSITHKNQEGNINKSMAQQQFIDYMSDETLNATCGMWHMDNHDTDTIIFWREYYSIGGNRFKEQLIVNIDLKPAIRAANNKVKKSWRYKLGI